MLYIKVIFFLESLYNNIMYLVPCSITPIRKVAQNIENLKPDDSKPRRKRKQKHSEATMKAMLLKIQHWHLL